MFRTMASCHCFLKRRKGGGGSGRKVRNKLRKKGEWAAWCQVVKQWNGMASGGRKTQFPPSELVRQTEES